MKQRNVTVLIITESLWWSGQPRMEIIVRQDAEWIRSLGLQGQGKSDTSDELTACPLPDSLLSTGFSEKRPCVCSETVGLLNCDGHRDSAGEAAVRAWVRGF